MADADVNNPTGRGPKNKRSWASRDTGGLYNEDIKAICAFIIEEFYERTVRPIP